MDIKKTAHENTIITVNEKVTDKVTSYKYLGIIIHKNWRQEKEVKSRIGEATAIFMKMRTILAAI